MSHWGLRTERAPSPFLHFRDPKRNRGHSDRSSRSGLPLRQGVASIPSVRIADYSGDYRLAGTARTVDREASVVEVDAGADMVADYRQAVSAAAWADSDRRSHGVPVAARHSHSTHVEVAPTSRTGLNPIRKASCSWLDDRVAYRSSRIFGHRHIARILLHASADERSVDSLVADLLPSQEAIESFGELPARSVV